MANRAGQPRATGRIRPCLLLLMAALLMWHAIAPAGAALAQPTLSVEGDAAIDEAAGFGVQGFHRAKRGSSSALPDGTQVGYRYITGEPDNVVLLATDEAAVLYVPDEACARVGFDRSDPDQVQVLVALLSCVDEANADGGVPLAQRDLPLTVTSEREVSVGALTYRFAVESQGRSYAAVQERSLPSAGDAGDAADGGRAGADAPEGVTPGTSAWFCDYGALVRSADMHIVTHRTPVQEVGAFLSRVDFSPLLVSLRTTLAATLIIAVVGTAMGWVARRLSTRVKNVLDTLFLIPMVLPPSACGLVLVYVFGKNSVTGQWLISVGVNLPFTWPAAVIAAVVVALPFMYRSARGAFEDVDAEMLDAARTLGWSEGRLFARLAVPLALPSLIAGVALSFARALGEFGATVFFAGNYAGVTQTIPLAIYYDWMAGDVALAWLWVCVMLLFTFAFLLFLHRADTRR